MSSKGKEAARAPSSPGGRCAACELLNRACESGCVFAPHFPAGDDPARFGAVHAAFGADNVARFLGCVPPDRRRADVARCLVLNAPRRLAGAASASGRTPPPCAACQHIVFAPNFPAGVDQARFAAVDARFGADDVVLILGCCLSAEQQEEAVRNFVRDARQPAPPPVEGRPPCATCRHLRRPCVPNCPLWSYFPPDDESERFAAVHAAYGASNLDTPAEPRGAAAATCVYEARRRQTAPVFGATGDVLLPQTAIKMTEGQLAATHKELAAYVGEEPSQAQDPGSRLLEGLEDAGDEPSQVNLCLKELFVRSSALKELLPNGLARVDPPTYTLARPRIQASRWGNKVQATSLLKHNTNRSSFLSNASCFTKIFAILLFLLAFFPSASCADDPSLGRRNCPYSWFGLATLSCQQFNGTPSASCCTSLLHAVDKLPPIKETGDCCLCSYVLSKGSPLATKLISSYISCSGKHSASIARLQLPVTSCDTVCHSRQKKHHWQTVVILSAAAGVIFLLLLCCILRRLCRSRLSRSHEILPVRDLELQSNQMQSEADSGMENRHSGQIRERRISSGVHNRQGSPNL